MEEEIALLEEQLATAHADIERLRGQLEEASARARQAEAAGHAVRSQLEAARAEVTERDALLAARERDLAAAREGLAASEALASDAAARYRDLLLRAEPDLPGDLVAGDSVGAVEESAARARETVVRVRRHLEQQAQAARVPAGSSVRDAPDLGALTPAEKIRQGLVER